MESFNGELPTIPTVDISAYLTHNAMPCAVTKVARDMRDACSTYGFMYLVGHGIPPADMEKILDCVWLFSALPDAEKMQVRIDKSMGKSFRGYEPPGVQVHRRGLLPDIKEAFTVGAEVAADDPEAGSFSTGPNLWPESLPDADFREPIMKYHAQMLQLSRTILEILSLGLVQEWNCAANVLCPLGEVEPCVPMRLLHYAPQKSLDERQFGVGDHTDFGCVSILLQEPGTTGLQVWYPPSESWVDVPVRSGAFVINMGDTMQKVTAGFYRSARHRVMASGSMHRHSVAFFLNGDLKLDCGALDGSDSNQAAKSTIGEHIKASIVKTMSSILS